MKQLIISYRKTILWQAIQSGLVLSLLLYAIIRSIFCEFPMSWPEEVYYFIKTVAAGAFGIATATWGTAKLYMAWLKLTTKKRS